MIILIIVTMLNVLAEYPCSTPYFYFGIVLTGASHWLTLCAQLSGRWELYHAQSSTNMICTIYHHIWYIYIYGRKCAD